MLNHIKYTNSKLSFYRNPILSAGLASVRKIRHPGGIAGLRQDIKNAVHGLESPFMPTDLAPYHAIIARKYMCTDESTASVEKFIDDILEDRGSENPRMKHDEMIESRFHMEIIRATMATFDAINGNTGKHFARPTGPIVELFNRAIDGYGSWELFPFADSVLCERVKWNKTPEDYLREYLVGYVFTEISAELAVFQQLCDMREFAICRYYSRGTSPQTWFMEISVDGKYPVAIRTDNLERYRSLPFHLQNVDSGTTMGKFTFVRGAI